MIRSTRQGSTRADNEEMTMKQLMGMMQGLQEEMAASKAEQVRMQADLAASQARNDELYRTNASNCATQMSLRLSPHQENSPRRSHRRS